MRRRLAVLLAAAVVVAPASRALAWAETGHRYIGRLGVEALPASAPAFLRDPAVLDQIAELSREPDRWRGAGRTHDSDRDAAHFIDLDDQGLTLSGQTLEALPERRADFEAALVAAHSDVGKSGYLPYAIVDGWQQLAKDFAYWRIETAALARDKDPAHKAWYAMDLKLREQLIVRDLGVWSHYVGDASMPMHVSVHYNGWGDYPNPRAFTQEHIHSPFEGAYVKANISIGDVRARIAPYKACAGPITPCIDAYLHQTWTQLIPTYELEKRVSWRTASPEGRAFVADRLAAGASALRDLVLDAWTASADMGVGYPTITVKDVQSGAVDPWDAIYGKA
jgi:hypothetical protein